MDVDGGSAMQCYKVKFLQVLDDADWDAAAVMRRFVDARFISPSILVVQSGRPEWQVIDMIHDSIHSKFRVFFESSKATFSVRMAREVSRQRRRRQRRR